MEFFDTITKRVVSFPVQSYDANKNKIINFFLNNKLFQLSVLISSRTLFNDSQKNKTEKIELSLEKYFSRAHYNPVPFGTFSSVGILQWGSITKVVKQDILHLKVDFDNGLITNNIKKRIETDWKNFEYLTNPSLHFLQSDKICYYKTEINEQGIFKTEFVEIDFDENTEWLINRFKNGAKIEAVILDLIETGFEKTEIDNFLYEIIQVGLIINRFLLNPYNNKKIQNYLNSNLVNQNIHDLDSQNSYDIFSKKLIEEQSDFQEKNSLEKNIFAITSFEKNEGLLNNDIKDKIIKYITFTINHQNNYSPVNEKLAEFGNKFYQSFNDEYIPITRVFNPYSGLKYPKIIKSELFLHEALLHKILFNKKKDINLNMVSKTSVVEKNGSNKFAPTFNVLFEVLVCKKTKKEIIYCKSLINGGTAIRLLSRFSYVTKNYCNDISEYEKRMYENKLIAEINMVEIPRTINIFSPTPYFDYNIPVNCSYTEDSNPILISDLYLRFDGSNFILVSKQHKKEIIPRIMSAIHHQIYESDIYRFLTELQFQKNEVQSIDLDLNHFKNHKIQFVPRIYLENDILLNPAQVLLVDNNLEFDDFKGYVYKIIEENSFCLRVCLSDEKGNIVIDLEKEDHMQKLYIKVKEKKYLYVTENLYDSFLPIIENESGNYAHEFLASIKNTEFVNHDLIFKKLKDEDFCDEVLIAENWFYIELYCNSYAESEVLNYINDSIISEIEYDKFFFVRYGDPENHIRVRFSEVSNKNKDLIIKLINVLKFNNIIKNYSILPYNQEFNRYGGSEMMRLTESVFHQDSLDTLKIVMEDLKDGDLYVFSILKIYFYLDFFDFTTEKMIQFCENNVANFSKEFELKSDLRKSFNADFAKIKNKIAEYEYENFLFNLDFKTELMNELKISNLTKENYLSSIIHMSMNRLFNDNQRYNEFKTYYLTKCYLNQLKFTQKNNN